MVKYCSEGCGKVGEADAALEGAILELLAERGAGDDMPEEAAIRLMEPAGLKGLMEPSRGAAAGGGGEDRDYAGREGGGWLDCKGAYPFEAALKRAV